MSKIKTNALLAEFIGSALLCGVVVGSGIMAFDLSNGNIAVALIGNSIATAAILWVLVAILGQICTCCSCLNRFGWILVDVLY